MGWSSLLPGDRGWRWPWRRDAGRAAWMGAGSFDRFLTVTPSHAVKMELACAPGDLQRLASGAPVTVSEAPAAYGNIGLTLAAEAVGPFCEIAVSREHGIVKLLTGPQIFFLEAMSVIEPIWVELRIKGDPVPAVPARESG